MISYTDDEREIPKRREGTQRNHLWTHRPRGGWSSPQIGVSQSPLTSEPLAVSLLCADSLAFSSLVRRGEENMAYTWLAPFHNHLITIKRLKCSQQVTKPASVMDELPVNRLDCKNIKKKTRRRARRQQRWIIIGFDWWLLLLFLSETFARFPQNRSARLKAA